MLDKIDGLLPKSAFSAYYEGYDAFSEMPGGRASVLKKRHHNPHSR
jgi:hypothetical protein